MVNQMKFSLDTFKQNKIKYDDDVWQFEKRKWRFCLLDYLKMKYQDNFEELLNKVA